MNEEALRADTAVRRETPCKPGTPMQAFTHAELFNIGDAGASCICVSDVLLFSHIFMHEKR
jgi:hypothetical protein